MRVMNILVSVFFLLTYESQF